MYCGCIFPTTLGRHIRSLCETIAFSRFRLFNDRSHPTDDSLAWPAGYLDDLCPWLACIDDRFPGGMVSEFSFYILQASTGMTCYRFHYLPDPVFSHSGFGIPNFSGARNSSLLWVDDWAIDQKFLLDSSLHPRYTTFIRETFGLYFAWFWWDFLQTERPGFPSAICKIFHVRVKNSSIVEKAPDSNQCCDWWIYVTVRLQPTVRLHCEMDDNFADKLVKIQQSMHQSYLKKL